MRATRGTPRRTDANQKDIVRALRQCGCSVLDLSAVGSGCPDILVSDREGVLHLMEIKIEKGKLNELQENFFETWRGRKPIVVRSVAEALHAVGIRLDI